jgi:hypothetical protein
MAAPSSLGITGYHTLFGKQPPEDRLALIRHLSKDILLLEIAGLNYRLSGGVTREMDISTKTQQQELFWFCGRDEQLFSRYFKIVGALNGREHINLFSRAQCAFAMEEIIQSDLPVIEGFTMMIPNTWEPLLQYLLTVNTAITRITEEKTDEPINFETLSPKLLPLNETMILNDPIFIINRGQELLHFLSDHQEVGPHIKGYLEATYKLSPDEFIFQIYSLLMANQSDAKHLDFHYQVADNHPSKYLFEILSAKFENADVKTLINIRKHPFFKRSANRYILTDQNYLIEKAYYQLINDFFFDYLKGATKENGELFSMQDYKSIIGRFFENYIDSMLRYSFKYHNEAILKTGDELKITIDKQSKELCDVYLRDHRKILIAEIKSTTIYDIAKYSGNVDALYKNDRVKFFKDFGINQVVKGISYLANKLKEVDQNLIDVKRPIVYPVIFLNDKVFQTPLFAAIFNDRFKELLNEIDTSSMHVYPLVLVHVSDLEQMQHALRNDQSLLWKLLEGNFRQRDRIIPPFYVTLSQYGIRHHYKIVEPKLYWMLDKFGMQMLNT